jgi:hypothetical protein
MFAIAIANQQHGTYYAAAGGSGVGAALRIASYQGLARSGLVTSALIMVWLRGWKSLAFGFGALVLLFLLGARTEFVGILLIMLISILTGSARWPAKILALAIVAVLVASVIGKFATILEQSRIRHLLNLGEDTSWQARALFTSRAQETIRSHWLLGSYGSELEEGGIGTYAHNALSAWVSFGLVGFLFFVGINLTCFGYTLIAAVRTRFRTVGLVQFAFVMSAYAIICMTFAKSVDDPIFAVSWGATAALLATRSAGWSNESGENRKVGPLAPRLIFELPTAQQVTQP